MPILDEVRITELPGADPLAGPELIPLVQDGVTKSRSAQNLVLDGGLQDHLDAADPHDQYAFGDWTIQDLDHNEYASLYSNSAGTEGVRVEYNASSKSLEYNFF